MNKFKIIAFYEFIEIKNLLEIKENLRKFATLNRIKGTILISREGINGTVAGSQNSIDELVSKLASYGLKKINPKFSYSEFLPFPRLKVRLKKEIVTFRKNDLDLENNKGEYVDPENWNNILNDPEITIIDVRNDFEVEMGSFKNSINPKTKNFTEFKEYADKNITNSKKIAMFCTGGIRCEKASSYLLSSGVEKVYQLKGGILKYLENININDSLFEGECFVFDRRVSLTHGLKEGNYRICSGCRNPINEEDKKSKFYEAGVSCKKCYSITSDAKKIGLRERNKQVQIAKEKNLDNPFIDVSHEDFFESGI
ncbi:MAG: rhodanese-related sulfurtransferase [Chloroflexota bacterium]|nr:rhodanese-related sulfurtransferase [Chloroflexota bacterium]